MKSTRFNCYYGTLYTQPYESFINNLVFKIVAYSTR